MTKTTTGSDPVSEAYRIIVLDAIATIEETKSDRHPAMAFTDEILRAMESEVKAAINNLIAEKRLRWSRTVNGQAMFATIPQ